MTVGAQRVFVSGCFDMFHSGHVCFLRTAADYGDLFVSVGADETVHLLKNRPPVYSQQERLYLIRALACVHEAVIADGVGLLDFEGDLRRVQPDVFVVNEDGDAPEKRQLCRDLGIEYVVLGREPAPGLPARSTTGLRSFVEIPYRIDLAGGWLDQPFVSRHSPGPVIVASVLPDRKFPNRTGMATSTRRTAQDLWGDWLPPGDRQQQGKYLFGCENPPGKTEISGSQDALGILLPGVNRLHYDGQYWPERIDSLQDEATLSWVEDLIYLKALGPRPADFCVLADTSISAEKAAALAEAADACWTAILRRDAAAMGDAVQRAFLAQVGMFPKMVNPQIEAIVEDYRGQSLGLKLTGAGGGGYLMMVSQTPIEDCLRVRITPPIVSAATTGAPIV